MLTPGGGVAARHLNKHIDYDTCCAPIPNAENARSLALPQGMAVTGNGATLYVAALGSDKVGVFSHGAARDRTRSCRARRTTSPSPAAAPRGLVLDEAREQLYVLTRFDNAISIIDTTTQAETRARRRCTTPSRRASSTGRRFLYDASFSSSHGDSSCASCHVFGDFDSLAWDLGNPDAPVTSQPRARSSAPCST